ncbi:MULTISPECIES: DNA polymerase I [Acetobacter]|uniref:DNA polymerase I n=3 Tax=Acetobacter TaxID=434 RepID=A0AAN1U8B8_9PROT|nr:MULTISPECIES: DNA polymerase I [Acetobacter]ASL41016.1 DNA polymerase I [Acetobacter oryzifermentans]AXM99662.1 DNA polymerase I [Acetobacter pomorum]KAA8393767.1 DNA polymerase I [Acetobacter sp. DmW_125124]KAA8396171.1 DNA polymerase I [Acetobacter sp. DmW_125128]KAA8398935.1 DNA polymerase I [Acetobacter sp. DmW_125127]
MTETPHLVLVDGSGFIFRAFHALPPMTSPEGVPVNAVYGFTTMLARLLKDHVGTHLAVLFDASRQTFRSEIYPQYKAHRPEPPEDLRPQFSLIREATQAFNVPGIELPGWEADDLIASYATAIRAQGGTCTIVSSDKDLMQLVGDGVCMLDPIKQTPVGPAEVETKFGVPPTKVVDVQALMGDPTDNVPGVPGIGPKTAAALVQEYGTLEAVLNAAPEMKKSKRRDMLIEHAEAARVSLQLVTLATDVPLPVPVDELNTREPDMLMLADWLDRMGFRSILSRMGLGHSSGAHAHRAAKKVAAASIAGATTPAADAAPTTDASVLSAPYHDYETIRTAEALQKWISTAQEAGICAVDTETDGLDPLAANIVGFSIATAPGKACYVPLKHEGTLEAPTGEQLAVDAALKLLAPLLQDDAVLKIFHNAKFDLLILDHAGIPLSSITAVDDTMLISYSQSAGLHGQGMDELSNLHLNHTPITYDSVTGTGRNRVPFAQVPVETATKYAAEDADVTLRLWYVLHPTLRTNKALALYEQIERPLSVILADMEKAGIAVDRTELDRLSKDFEARMQGMENDIYEAAGRQFNIGSPKQLGEILFDEMGLKGGKRGKAGAWSTDSSVLQDLADQGHDLPARILAWRQLAKLKSTYTDALLRQAGRDDRVHTSFQMAITSTGRLSSTDPNLQNIPVRTEEGTRIRQAFIAPSGKKLISADYSQIELRLLADVANIPALREAFQLGQDIHARTASEVFNIPLEGMDALTRRRAKAINFGIIYGISAFGLGKQLGIPAGEARTYIDAYFARYPGIRDYMERMREEARTHGYVLTPFGRRCYVPGIHEKSAARRQYAERQAINAPLQGGAADIIKRAMVHLPLALQKAGFGATRMLLQVHDELLFETDESDAEAVAEIIKNVMEAAADLAVPLVVETGIGQNWAEAH